MEDNNGISAVREKEGECKKKRMKNGRSQKKKEEGGGKGSGGGLQLLDASKGVDAEAPCRGRKGESNENFRGETHLGKLKKEGETFWKIDTQNTIVGRGIRERKEIGIKWGWLVANYRIDRALDIFWRVLQEEPSETKERDWTAPLQKEGERRKKRLGILIGTVQTSQPHRSINSGGLGGIGKVGAHGALESGK